MPTKPLNPLRNVQEYIKLPLLYDYWYVAGLAEEFGHTLKAKTLLERSVVFFRRTDGMLIALQNRCAHRSFPLSESKLIGDEIQCGYHGIRYNSEEEIVDVPCQTSCPSVRLRKYPVVERGPLVWIWMGDPDKAEITDIPETECLTSPNWVSTWGQKTLEGNYLLMHENLADLSHLPFLHANTFGASGDWASVPVEVERERNFVHYWRSTEDWNMTSSLYPPTLACDGRKILGKLGATFVSPAMCRGWTRVEILDASNGEQRLLENEINHYLTPENHDSAHYYWSFARNTDIDNVQYTERFKHVVDAAFDEDRTATKFMQDLLNADKHNMRDISIAGDKSSVMVRKVIIEIADRA